MKGMTSLFSAMIVAGLLGGSHAYGQTPPQMKMTTPIAGQ